MRGFCDSELIAQEVKKMTNKLTNKAYKTAPLPLLDGVDQTEQINHYIEEFKKTPIIEGLKDIGLTIRVISKEVDPKTNTVEPIYEVVEL